MEKNTYMTKRREKKTKEQNINVFQSLLGGLIGLPERDQAWTSVSSTVERHYFKLSTEGK